MGLIPLRPFFGLTYQHDAFSQYIEHIHLFVDKIQQALSM